MGRSGTQAGSDANDSSITIISFGTDDFSQGGLNLSCFII